MQENKEIKIGTTIYGIGTDLKDYDIKSGNGKKLIVESAVILDITRDYIIIDKELEWFRQGFRDKVKISRHRRDLINRICTTPDESIRLEIQDCESSVHSWKKAIKNSENKITILNDMLLKEYGVY